MSKSSVIKTVGGVTTKITTMSRIHTSSSQQQILQQQQQQQQQQHQTNRNVNTVRPQFMMDTRKEQHISLRLTQKNPKNNRQNQQNDTPAPRMEFQQLRTENMCVRCKRPAYKMVEVIAENQVWHRNCFRCNECDKQLKFHAKGMDVGVPDLKPIEKERKNETYDNDSIYSEDYDDETDVDLLRAKRLQRERPLHIDDMNEIKNKFEGGIEQGREARYLERKQEVQDSRSRIYMGKQARTRELYENAVDRLENSPKLRNRGLLLSYELDNVKAAAEKTQNVKQRFETGDVYRRDTKSVGREFHESVARQCSKQSQISDKVSERMQMLAKQQAQDDFVKSRAKVQIMETAQILNQFDFFENTNPDKQKVVPSKSMASTSMF